MMEQSFQCPPGKRRRIEDHVEDHIDVGCGGNVTPPTEQKSPFIAFPGNNIAYGGTPLSSFNYQYPMAPFDYSNMMQMQAQFPLFMSTPCTSQAPAVFHTPPSCDKSVVSTPSTNDSGISENSPFGIQSSNFPNFPQENPADEEDVFTQVPSRLTIGNPCKFKISIAEIKRRVNAPEMMNSSMLGAYLRRPKLRENGDVLRKQLEEKNVFVPPGKKKGSPITCFSALAEEESMQMAKEYEALMVQAFPTDAVAAAVHADHPLPTMEARAERLRDLQGAFRVISDWNNKLNDVPTNISACPTHDRPQADVQLQLLMQHFSLLTHGFGVANMKSWMAQMKYLVHAQIQKANY